MIGRIINTLVGSYFGGRKTELQDSLLLQKQPQLEPTLSRLNPIYTPYYFYKSVGLERQLLDLRSKSPDGMSTDITTFRIE